MTNYAPTSNLAHYPKMLAIKEIYQLSPLVHDATVDEQK